MQFVSFVHKLGPVPSQSHNTGELRVLKVMPSSYDEGMVLFNAGFVRLLHNVVFSFGVPNLVLALFKELTIGGKGAVLPCGV